MTASNPIRRTKTAKELAALFGVSERTVRRLVAEPRDAFRDRARVREAEALALFESGLKHREVGERMGISETASAGLVCRARKRQALVDAINAERGVSESCEGQDPVPVIE